MHYQKSFLVKKKKTGESLGTVFWDEMEVPFFKFLFLFFFFAEKLDLKGQAVLPKKKNSTRREGPKQANDGQFAAAVAIESIKSAVPKKKKK